MCPPGYEGLLGYYKGDMVDMVSHGYVPEFEEIGSLTKGAHPPPHTNSGILDFRLSDLRQTVHGSEGQRGQGLRKGNGFANPPPGGVRGIGMETRPKIHSMFF